MQRQPKFIHKSVASHREMWNWKYRTIVMSLSHTFVHCQIISLFQMDTFIVLIYCDNWMCNNELIT